jgi:hypothetical protein
MESLGWKSGSRVRVISSRLSSVLLIDAKVMI